MTKIRNFIILLISGMLLFAVPCGAADYLESIRESVCNIELGKYNEAAADAEEALALYDADPLAYLAFGAIYLHAGRLSEADQEFNKLIELQPGNWRAEYGLGLTDLLRGKDAEAAAHFDTARKDPASAQDLAALELYLSYINGRPCTKSMFEDAALPLGRETCALQTMEAGKKDAAMEIFKDVLSTLSPVGFDENRSPIATFNPKSPVALPGGRLTWKPAERQEAATATGMVTLNADASRANGVVYVSLYVDDQLAGVTNYEPYQFEWNTARHPNGMHKIRIEGKNEAGSVVSSKTVWVKVKNANSSGLKPKTGAAAEELMERLWNCIRVGESRKFAYYEIGRWYLAGGDVEKGMEYLEYAAAYDPAYMNISSILSDLRKKRTNWQPAVKRVPSAGKKIALTFDDGPNERTKEMLDMLDRLKVPGTFFLVGFRAESQPELVREIVARGHQVENHSYTHPNLTSLPAEQVAAELSKNAAIIRAITGKPSLYFRPPGGHASKSTIEASTRLGLTGVFWTLLCSPYEGAKSRGLADYVIRNACDGAIVLMHNGEPGTTASLPKIVVELKAKGYKFVTISELLAPEPPA